MSTGNKSPYVGPEPCEECGGFGDVLEGGSPCPACKGRCLDSGMRVLYRSITLNVPEWLLRAIAAEAEKNGTSMNKTVVRYLRYGIRDHLRTGWQPSKMCSACNGSGLDKNMMTPPNRMTVRIPASLFDSLHTQANKLGTSMNKLAVEFIRAPLQDRFPDHHRQRSADGNRRTETKARSTATVDP